MKDLAGVPKSNALNEPQRPPFVSRRETALLVIDLQYLDADPDLGIFADLERYQLSAAARDQYFSRLEATVLPHVRKLQDAFRARGMEVIHTRIQSLTKDGRDRSTSHKELGILATPGSREAQFLPEVAPRGDEIIINKTASGAFSATNLQYLLRNLGIGRLVVTGVFTNECVSTTVRNGSDMGYAMTLVDDACASYLPELHDTTLKMLGNRYARVCQTREILDELEPVSKT